MTLRARLPVVAGLLLLAGCGPQLSREEQLIAADCEADGGAAAGCVCMAQRAADELDPDVFRAMVLAAEGREAEAETLLESLPVDRQMSGVAFALETLDLCDMEAGEEAAG
jgi:hypothetical protein